MSETSNNDNNLDLIEAFKLFDTNNDGSVSVKELGCIMRALGLTPTESDIQDLLNKMGILYK